MVEGGYWIASAQGERYVSADPFKQMPKMTIDVAVAEWPDFYHDNQQLGIRGKKKGIQLAKKLET